MGLASELTTLGLPPERLEVECEILMDEVEGQGHQIVGSSVKVTVKAEVDADVAGGRARAGRRGLSVLRAAEARRRHSRRRARRHMSYSEPEKAFGALEGFDPAEGVTILEPQAPGAGNWVGCPTVVYDPSRESISMTYRRRRPRRRAAARPRPRMRGRREP